jgi:hypothetical protein
VAGLRAAQTAADGSGHYEIAGIDKGTYGVTVNDLERGAFATSLDVAGSTTFDIDIRGAAVAGKVVDGATGAALANASIELRRRDAAFIRNALSGANGEFSFEQLPPGAYDARAQRAGYGAATLPVTVGDDGAPPLEIKLTPSSGLALTLVDGRDNRPLSGWAHAEGSGTSYDGAAASLPLAAGSYRITAGASGYAPRTFDAEAPGERTVALTPGGAIVVASTSNAFAMMRVLDGSGQPVRLGPGAAPGLVRIDPAPGQTRLGNVAAGDYVLQLLDDRNAVVRSTRVTVREGEVVNAAL